ncbi:hypothetical protein KHA96_18295 [Bacillus sp. FJAT-49711]|nr:hypothetical protein [Bacillus sp. FJAT-49711]
MFISIFNRAFPFIMLAVIISSFIQIILTDEMLAKVIPKNRFLSVLSATSPDAIVSARLFQLPVD